VDAAVAGLAPPRRFVAVHDLLVDTGSELTWIAESLLISIGIEVSKKDTTFVMANGATVTRSIGYAIIRAQGFETVDEVVLARPGDLAILGARTLEGFGAVVDARRKRLVAAGPHPAAGSAFVA
jgi:predicted aspartyl protease